MNDYIIYLILRDSCRAIHFCTYNVGDASLPGLFGVTQASVVRCWYLWFVRIRPSLSCLFMPSWRIELTQGVFLH